MPGTSVGPAVPEPVVSICIPSFNAERHIRKCIESVLQSDVESIELIVADDASTDGTWEIVLELVGDDPRATVLRHPQNLGAAANWDEVLRLARGRYVKLLCSDDHLLPGGLAEIGRASCRERVCWIV